MEWSYVVSFRDAGCLYVRLFSPKSHILFSCHIYVQIMVTMKVQLSVEIYQRVVGKFYVYAMHSLQPNLAFTIWNLVFIPQRLSGGRLCLFLDQTMRIVFHSQIYGWCVCRYKMKTVFNESGWVYSITYAFFYLFLSRLFILYFPIIFKLCNSKRNEAAIIQVKIILFVIIGCSETFQTI